MVTKVVTKGLTDFWHDGERITCLPINFHVEEGHASIVCNPAGRQLHYFCMLLVTSLLLLGYI